MTIESLRQIPIEGLLSHLGFEPVARRRGGISLFYRSPLRHESRASFIVNTSKNIWIDMGSGMGGNVIDLTVALLGGCTFHAAAEWLEARFSEFGDPMDLERTPTYFNPKRATPSDFRNIKVIPLESRPLLSYLMSRGIPIEVGTRYCEEVHYSVFGKEYFGLCFKNILGGMEIRNVYFKGCYGSKAPSLVPVDKLQHTGTCCVFEGFMDFLSYQVLCEQNDPVVIGFQDCIVLNSTSLVNKAIPFIDVYDKVYCFLDNDEAGRGAAAQIGELLFGKVESRAQLYAEYNDLNDYLRGIKQP